MKLIHKACLSILACMASIGLAGCDSVDGRLIINRHSVESVTLECVDTCLNMEDPPFLRRTYPDAKSIRLFVRAIKQSDKIRGELDYAAMFTMSVRLKGGQTKAFVLNVAREESYTKGLLVKQSDSSQGFSISESMTQELKEIIYDTE